MPAVQRATPKPVKKKRRQSRLEVTPRELEIMQLVADGYTYNAAGDVLGVSPETVRTHKARVLIKLDAVSQTQAVAILLRRGLIR